MRSCSVRDLLTQHWRPVLISRSWSWYGLHLYYLTNLQCHTDMPSQKEGGHATVSLQEGRSESATTYTVRLIVVTVPKERQKKGEEGREWMTTSLSVDKPNDHCAVQNGKKKKFTSSALIKDRVSKTLEPFLATPKCIAVKVWCCS